MHGTTTRALLGLTAAALLCTGAAPATQASPAALTCDQLRLPVDHAGGTRHVYGELCFRGEVGPDTPVQVLLHGGTYDHRYWDWPYDPRTYSYVDQATRNGFATLNLDRLGYGRSDHPDPSTVDFAAGGDVVHQLVERLRAGELRTPFRTVVLNGHSMGGIVAQHAAAHGGVDAVVVSGIPRNPAAGSGARAGGDPFYPAEQDPMFAGESWAAGYFTTRPSTRIATFHYPGTYDPAVARGEESMKDTVPGGELCTLRPCGGTAPAPASAPREVPTLYVLGRHDLMFCGTTEDCATDPGAGDTEHLVPDSGHSINLSHGARRFYQLTFRWLAEQGIG